MKLTDIVTDEEFSFWPSSWKYEERWGYGRDSSGTTWDLFHHYRPRPKPVAKSNITVTFGCLGPSWDFPCPSGTFVVQDGTRLLPLFWTGGRFPEMTEASVFDSSKFVRSVFPFPDKLSYLYPYPTPRLSTRFDGVRTPVHRGRSLDGTGDSSPDT